MGSGDSTRLVTEDAVASSETTSGLDFVVHEASTALLLDSGEERRLLAEQSALGETRSIRKAGLVLDVSIQHVPGAGLAEVSRVGADQEEGQVVGGEGGGVGNDVVACLGEQGGLDG